MKNPCHNLVGHLLSDSSSYELTPIFGNLEFVRIADRGDFAAAQSMINSDVDLGRARGWALFVSIKHRNTPLFDMLLRWLFEKHNHVFAWALENDAASLVRLFYDKCLEPL